MHNVQEYCVLYDNAFALLYVRVGILLTCEKNPLACPLPFTGFGSIRVA